MNRSKPHYLIFLLYLPVDSDSEKWRPLSLKDRSHKRVSDLLSQGSETFPVKLRHGNTKRKIEATKSRIRLGWSQQPRGKGSQKKKRSQAIARKADRSWITFMSSCWRLSILRYKQIEGKKRKGCNNRIPPGRMLKVQTSMDCLPRGKT
jgi:hypothetical protein